MMKGVTEGRMCHYVLSSLDLPEHRQHLVGVHRPAMIVNSWPDLNRDDGYCNLLVFMDGTNDMDKIEIDLGPPEERVRVKAIHVPQFMYWATSRVYNEEKQPGSWHWIEQA